MSGVVKEEPKVKAEAFFLEIIKVMTPHDMVDGIILATLRLKKHGTSVCLCLVVGEGLAGVGLG